MRFEPTLLDGVLVVRTEPIRDHRGHFVRTYCVDEFAGAGIDTAFLQVNAQFSPRIGTVRGLHFQTGDAAEIKYVHCTRGRVWDVAVDMRQGSPTFLRHVAVELTPDNGTALVVGRGHAHGFVTLEPDSEVTYMTDRRFDPSAATGVRHDDPRLAIEWPIAVEVISERDASWELIGV